MDPKSARIVITVDGLAGCGKSSISSLLARRIGFVHFTSGALYRCLGFLAMQKGLQAGDEQSLIKALKHNSIELTLVQNSSRVLLNGVEISSELYLPEVSEFTSKIAALPLLRHELVEKQREVFKDKNIVAEGRDMGTVIFPSAQIKFFVVANQEVRIKRRLEQLKSAQSEQAKDLVDIVRKEIIERDQRDTQRLNAPTKAANDAIIIDNSIDPLDQVVGDMYKILLERRIINNNSP